MATSAAEFLERVRQHDAVAVGSHYYRDFVHQRAVWATDRLASVERRPDNTEYQLCVLLECKQWHALAAVARMRLPSEQA